MIFLSDIQNTIRQAVASQASGCSYIDMEVRVGSTVYFRLSSRKISSYYEFPGAEELIRTHMLTNNLSVFSATAVYYVKNAAGSQIDTYSQSFAVLFHGSKLLKAPYRTADEVVSNNFLIPYKDIFVFGASSYTLPYYASESGTITVTRYFADGTTDTLTYTSATGYGTRVVNKGNCLYAHVEFGYRRADIYFVETSKVERFSFRNVFNAPESVNIPAAMELNPKTEFETAQQEKVLQRYDIEQQLEMSLKTGVLPAAMYKQLISMCRARSVTYYTAESLPTAVSDARAISIEEYKLPKSTEPNTPITFEMKFRYCDTELNDAVILG